MTDDGIRTVVARMGRGDLTAAGELYTAYAAHVRALVRRRLATRPRVTCDSANVAQSVWAQVFGRVGAGCPVSTDAEFRALLAVIARRRVATRAREPLPAPPVGDGVCSSVATRHESRPGAPAADAWKRLLRLCPPHRRDVLRLRRDGLTPAEVAARTGLPERGVRRLLRQLFRAAAVGGGADADPGAAP
jgi:DNA-directed RNA polymerase specialized sigma24 family protein